MRKIYIALMTALLSVPVTLMADTVSQETARKVALSVLETVPQTRAAQTLSLVWNGLEGASGDAPFYVFNGSNGGFAIVAGDDAMEPVLGYSLTGNFVRDGMPESISYWLEGYRQAFAQARRSNARPSESISRRWEEMLYPTKAYSGAATVVDLYTPLWNQYDPFNQNCPEYGGTKCVTGCNATAAAIVMAYYQWPDAGYGSTKAYTTSTRGISVPSVALSTYDWSNALYYYGSSATDAQKSAAAAPCSDVGRLLESDYDLPENGGTSAVPEKVGNVLAQYMKFDKSFKMEYKSAYSNAEWVAKIKSNLDRNMPLIYAGFAIDGYGHTFVIDGYDSNGFIKFNWGWGGVDNGFFYISDVEYYKSCMAYFDLLPDKSWTASSFSSLCYYINENGGRYGIWADKPYIKAGESATVSATVLNSGTGTYSGTLAFGVLHSSGSLTRISGEWSLNLKPDSYSTIQETVTVSSISEGDQIVVFYVDSDGYAHSVAGGAIELVYSLEDKVSMTYDGSYVTLRGLVGMTCSFNGRDRTFSAPSLRIAAPSSGSYDMKIGNGNETLTVKLTF